MGEFTSECKHGMIPAYCADCKKLLSPEEEQEQLDAMFIHNITRWKRNK